MLLERMLGTILRISFFILGAIGDHLFVSFLELKRTNKCFIHLCVDSPTHTQPASGGEHSFFGIRPYLSYTSLHSQHFPSGESVNILDKFNSKLFW